MKRVKLIAILGSGSGTNTEKIIEYFANAENIKVALIMSDKADAYILERALKHGIPAIAINKKELNETDHVFNLLKERNIDFIVLAGFLKLIPDKIIKAFKGRIINIHPALLPDFGGKDMYGSKVHESVIASGTVISGITVHYVNEKYDEGEIIFQAACHVAKGDTAETLASKIHQLEYKYYSVVIEKLLNNL
jgi:phosphoribosylglycinamide formyltransferase-1